MRDIFLAIIVCGLLAACGKTENTTSNNCLTGETEEQCLERTMPATSSGDSD